MLRVKKDPEIENLKEVLISEIQSADILPDDIKEDVIGQILTELKKNTRQTWFNCKMILFKNRYDNIDKDIFFDWLDQTHLRDLIELQGGFR